MRLPLETREQRICSGNEGEAARRAETREIHAFSREKSLEGGLSERPPGDASVRTRVAGRRQRRPRQDRPGPWQTARERD